MKRVLLFCLSVWMGLFMVDRAAAQMLTFTTVDRPPFSMPDEAGGFDGFSIDLMEAVAAELGREVRFELSATFPAMFQAIADGRVDGAVANISITAEREQVLDFSQPIFDAGLQIMVPNTGGEQTSVLRALLRWEIAALIAAAFVLLMGGGFLMWLFERRRQDYFDRDARDALFPSFWWALNLVVNGGFEERVPQSHAGRVFAVILVVSSLFIVSIFVAHITTAMTVQAITNNIQSIDDLDGRRVATTEGSTASAFLNARGIAHARFSGFAEVLSAFEAGEADAVVFDGPLLSYYVRTDGQGRARMIDRVFRRESYGIALPQGSALREDINRALLALRENGQYDEIRQSWFGASP